MPAPTVGMFLLPSVPAAQEPIVLQAVTVYPAPATECWPFQLLSAVMVVADAMPATTSGEIAARVWKVRFIMMDFLWMCTARFKASLAPGRDNSSNIKSLRKNRVAAGYLLFCPCKASRHAVVPKCIHIVK